MSKKKKKHKKVSKEKYNLSLSDEILQLFNDFPDRKLNYKQIASLLNKNTSPFRKQIYTILSQLADDGVLKEVSLGKFKKIENHLQHIKTSKKTSSNLIVGTIETTKRGAGYVLVEGQDKDIYIAEKNRNRSLNGDTVSVKISRNRKGKKLEGEIIEILESANKIIVGTLDVSDKFAFLIPDNQKLDIDVFIPKSKLKDAKSGYKALVKITEWPPNAKNPYGEVIDVLGRTESNDAEMISILVGNNIPYEFSTEVLTEANKIDTELSKKEISTRRDFRTILTFTIDPVDAKDFDDALSIEYLENGNLRVGIHIADVAHYVTEGSALDKEAYVRGNSTYLVDRVVPMLPEHLSNGVCSLRPNEEKFTFSAVFEINFKGDVMNEWFGKTVIFSDRRFTYEEAQERIETKKGDLAQEINDLDRIAKILRAKRIKNGALEIVSSEIRFELDENGNPIDTHKKTSKDANKLVEEFMLLANKHVAKFVGDVSKRKTQIPFIYRVHDKPDEKKLEMFKVFLSKFDINFDYSNINTVSIQMNKLFEDLKNEPEFPIIQQMAVRTMAKAVYDTKNIGHYGLGFRYYTHFTSPIRRYADLMVHRILLETINKKNKKHHGLQQVAEHISRTERRSVNAERDSQKYFQAYYLKDKIGEEHQGIITGVTDWGMYVEMVDLLCEGMVRLNSIEFDHFYFDEKSHAIIGNNSNTVYNLGDKVTVKIKAVSVAKKQVDLGLV
ncbi:MAG TPA: ribonuclease R [Crocinitomix sp.]|nr:ribonuclease R [Crocinitomix sp.]